MGAAFIWSIYNQAIYQQNNQYSTNQTKTIVVDTLALCIFNYFTNNHEISDLLTVSTLLGLSKYYTLEKSLK